VGPANSDSLLKEAAESAGSSRSTKDRYSPFPALDGRDSIRLMFNYAMVEQRRASSRAPGLFAAARRRRLQCGWLVGAARRGWQRGTLQQEGNGLQFPGHVIDRNRPGTSRPLLAGRLERGTAARKWLPPTARSLRRGTWWADCKHREMFGQPLAALGQGLGMGEHLTDCGDSDAAEHGRCEPQNQGSPDFPNSSCSQRASRDCRDPALDRVLDGHHGLHHSGRQRGARITARMPACGTSSTSPNPFKVSQGSGGLLAIGSSGTKKGKTH